MSNSEYEFDVPKYAKIVRNIDTGDLYAKFQIVDPTTLESVLKELGWFEPNTEINKLEFKFILQSKKSFGSTGKYQKYKVISCYEDSNGDLVISLGTYIRKPAEEWSDTVTYSKPKPISMIRWIKVDKTTVTMKMKIPVEVSITLNR